VAAAYSARALEYVDVCGTIESVHPDDLGLVTSWAEKLTGPVVDAGCGPGHWTCLLASLGVDVEGVDVSETFVEHARRESPELTFRVGDIAALGVDDGSLGGILSWYSTIHHTPGRIAEPLAEFARTIRPGGGLLLGFFEWPELEPFDHAVVTAYRWPVELLCADVAAAGFEIVETHTRHDPGTRPHGTLIARRL
jgi:SAM-dependent methyltransferase